MTDKTTLRQATRRLRAGMSAAAQTSAQTTVARHLRRILRPGLKLAVYMAMGSELSLTPLIDAAVRRRCQVFLPVIPKRGRIMRFSSMTRGDGHWQKNRYGIDEYVARRTVAARQMDVVLLPLVAFDRQGRRLGQGGGYYDATFAFRMRRQHWKRPRLIGVAFSCQRVGQVPTDPHDVMLDAVVTEAGWADCRITRPGS